MVTSMITPESIVGLFTESQRALWALLNDGEQQAFVERFQAANRHVDNWNRVTFTDELFKGYLSARSDSLSDEERGLVREAWQRKANRLAFGATEMALMILRDCWEDNGRFLPFGDVESTMRLWLRAERDKVKVEQLAAVVRHGGEWETCQALLPDVSRDEFNECCAELADCRRVGMWRKRGLSEDAEAALYYRWKGLQVQFPDVEPGSMKMMLKLVEPKVLPLALVQPLVTDWAHAAETLARRQRKVAYGR